VTGERGRGDALLGGQLAQAHPGVVPDQPEQRHLPARNPEVLGLLAELPAQAQEDRAKIIRDSEGVEENLVNH
jgi:hypothetical protein